MRKTKAARDCCSSPRAKSCPQRTHSIVANNETFRLAAATVAFTLGMLAIPTIMAALKAMGVW